MTNELSNQILQKPIHALNMSKEFKAMAHANKFNTLDEILKESFHELPFMKLSGYRMLRELLDTLEENGLSELIED